MAELNIYVFLCILVHSLLTICPFHGFYIDGMVIFKRYCQKWNHHLNILYNVITEGRAQTLLPSMGSNSITQAWAQTLSTQAKAQTMLPKSGLRLLLRKSWLDLYYPRVASNFIIQAWA